MLMRKMFYVIAYDVTNDKRRNRVSQLLEKYGVRVNYSVFECMLAASELDKLKKAVMDEINSKTDSVIYYPICSECYSKVVYQGACTRSDINIVHVL